MPITVTLKKRTFSQTLLFRFTQFVTWTVVALGILAVPAFIGFVGFLGFALIHLILKHW